jgi:hypothetical protein
VTFVVACALTWLVGAGAAQAPPDAAPCTFPSAEVEWLQSALNGWEKASREFLGTDPTPLPWIVLFDAACVWHLNPDPPPEFDARPVQTGLTVAGATVPVRAVSHRGTILLPNGTPLSVEAKASTSLYRNGRSAFFVMAMPSVWRSREVSDRARAEYLHGAFTHEMTHIRLVVDVNRRVLDLARENDLAYPLNDDVVQSEFRRVAGFEAAIRKERDLFYRAVLEPDSARRRTLTSRALGMVRQRHARYFTGANAAYAELESLFLTMEGVGQWAAYRLVRARTGASVPEALRLVRDSRHFWSQDEGLALFLLVDAMIPGWQSRVFNPEPISPFELLEEALAARR